MNKKNKAKTITENGSIKEKFELEVLVAFTDKYTNQKYAVGDILNVNAQRANELLNDNRKLVKEKVDG